MKMDGLYHNILQLFNVIPSKYSKFKFELISFYLLNKKIKCHNKFILILKLDALGDYILFRNFFTFIKKSKKYKDYKLILIGNLSNKEFSEKLDCNVIDYFLWVDNKKLSYSKSYFFEIIKKIRVYKPEIIINPTKSRGHFFTDDIVKFSGCKTKIGSEADNLFLTENEIRASNRKYDIIIPLKTDEKFEFYHNQYFISKLIGKNVDIIKPEIILNEKLHIFKNYICIFPGAGEEFRCWNHLNYNKLIRKILNQFKNIKVLVIGSEKEINLCNKVCSNINNKNLINYVSKTSIYKSLCLINESLFVIGNDSASIHMAAALNKKGICISNGNHFLRFNPYPWEMKTRISTIYPNNNFYDKEKTNKLYLENKRKSDLDINNIDFEKVFNIFTKNIYS